GGGKWYNNQNGNGTDATIIGYRGVLIDGTTEPLAFYGFHNQGIRSDAISEIKNASNVTLYGVKSETHNAHPTEHSLLWPRSLIISNSSNIGIYGFPAMQRNRRTKA